MSNSSKKSFHWNLPSHGSMDDGGLPGATNSGRWQQLSSKLSNVGAALRVNAERMGDISDVKSVPDIWGHVIAFRNALYNNEDSLHEQAVSQWRGLLTLIGLQQIQRSVYTLEIKQIDTGKASRDGLARLAGKFRPKLSIEAGVNLDVIQLLYLEADGQSNLVGLITPDTLVAPGRNVVAVSIANAAWFAKGPSCPIASRAALSPEQELALAAFIDQLAKAVSAAKPPSGQGGSIKPLLSELLQVFASDLRESAGGDSRVLPELSPVSTIRADSGVLAALNQVYTPGEVSGDVTDLQVNLRTDISGKGAFKGFILADPDFAEQHKRRADRVTVWRERRLSEVANPKAFDAIRQEALRSDYLLIRPDDIFNDVYVPFSSKAALAHGAELAQGLLPLKPIILMMLPPDEIPSRLRLVEERKGRWVFELTLDVMASDGRGSVAKHVLRKEYVTTDAHAEARSKSPGLAVANAAQNFKLEAPETLAAWPDFRHRNWRWNFLYFKAEHYAAIPLAGVSGEIMRRDLASVGSGESRIGRLDQWSTLNNVAESDRWPGTLTRERADAGSKPWFERLAITQRSPRGGEDQTELQRCDVPFEAVCFRAEATSDLVGESAAQTYFAGIGLLPKLVQTGLRDDRASLAIDFGTTNTTVYFQLDGAQECRFKSRLRLFKSTDHGSGARPYASFMPAEEVSQPFGTLLADRNPRWHGDELPRWQSMGSPEPALWQSHIMFGEDFEKILGTLWPDKAAGANPDADDSRLRSGFKWSAEAEQRGAIGRFLTHCAVLSLAELCAQGVPPHNVDWRFSFPTAMNLEDSNDFYARARAVVQELNDDYVSRADGVTITPPTVYNATEAVAAAVYFREEFKTQKPRSYIVLDIGGGTTDIGIWERDGQVWSGSFLLAGGDLMLDFIAKNKAFLETLSVGTRDMLGPHIAGRLLDELPTLRRTDTRGDKTIAFLVNSAAFRRRFEEYGPNISGRPEVRKLYAGARLMLGGLLYYVGMQVRGLLEHPEYSQGGKGGLDANAFDSTRIAFAGRGSTLFFQMHNGGVNSRLASTYALFNAGRRQDDDPEAASRPVPSPSDVRFSPVPKHEVALGMLHMTKAELGQTGDDLDLTQHGRAAFMVSGEVIAGPPDRSADNKSATVRATEGVNEIAKRFKGQRLEVQSLHQFDQFLTALQANTGLALHLPDGVRSTLEEALREEAEAWIGVTPLKGSESLRRPEPPFIRLLRETMRRLYLEPGPGVSKDEVITFEMTR